MTRAVAIGVSAALSTAFVVWFVGFDVRWATAAALVIGGVGGAIATLSFDESQPWDAHARETRRGIRLAVATIEQSLAACDRLARPAAVRRVHAMLSSERDDHLARATVVRQVRALLDPDAFATLLPDDGTPVTTAAIARCLDAIEHHDTTTPESR